MRTKFFVATAALSCWALSGCGSRPEFAPETVQAYQANDGLRSDVMQKCAAHASAQTPFATASDTQECQKAATAQANLNYAAHIAREREANGKVAAEINQLADGGASPTKP